MSRCVQRGRSSPPHRIWRSLLFSIAHVSDCAPGSRVVATQAHSPYAELWMGARGSARQPASMRPARSYAASTRCLASQGHTQTGPQWCCSRCHGARSRRCSSGSSSTQQCRCVLYLAAAPHGPLPSTSSPRACPSAHLPPPSLLIVSTSTSHPLRASAAKRYHKWAGGDR